MKRTHTVAILGHGVVGRGVCDLITNNQRELVHYLGCEVKIAHILDLRDFPDSPYGELVTHLFDDILLDESVETVIEAMGGSHPAYEYTQAALSAGKNVITSNKEVVANFGDKLVRLAAENGVSYRFEAAVGGGIPVIAPMLSSIRQNRILEVRGILNGTTNYILTKMFTYGDSFESALSDAQALGYAEKNPDADILGTDSARKIAILTALALDMLPSVDEIHTEGITGIRASDVRFAESIGHRIKLLGRCISNGGKPVVCVAPFLIPCESPLASVNGVYNAVEIVAEPLGNVMFYGQGAGAGATASAIVGDMIPIVTGGGYNPIVPGFNRAEHFIRAEFSTFSSRFYIAADERHRDELTVLLEAEPYSEEGGEVVYITKEMTEKEMDALTERFEGELLSKIRFI
nr:homoserine dehydrogenase [Clostridia bacterium]